MKVIKNLVYDYQMLFSLSINNNFLNIEEVIVDF